MCFKFYVDLAEQRSGTHLNDLARNLFYKNLVVKRLKTFKHLA